MNIFALIKSKVRIEDLVQEYVTLKRFGHYLKGACPFHHEKTPSFTVSPDKGIFYCFGCHAGGDAIAFFAQIERVSQLEAARELAQRYGIEIPADAGLDQQAQDDAHRYLEIGTLTSEWCREQYKRNAHAQAYLLQRGIQQKTIDFFELGFFAPQVQQLLTFAYSKGLVAKDLVDAQILFDGKHGMYSPFEERIMFPIHDIMGRVVGFGGRVFKPEDPRVKYYNSHEHALFNKRALLYGLDKAKKTMQKNDRAILVEGYIDCIMMHQAGFTETVATLGTSCTLEHLQQLSRFVSNVFIMYDGDSAGNQALLRLAEMCWQTSLTMQVIQVPQGEDPASYIVKSGNVQNLLQQAHGIFEYCLQQQRTALSQASFSERLELIKHGLSMVSRVSDPIKRELLMAQASEVFALPLSAVRHEVNALKLNEGRAIRTKIPEVEAKKNTLFEIRDLEKRIICGILFDEIELDVQELEALKQIIGPDLGHIITALLALRKQEKLPFQEFFDTLKEEEKVIVSRLTIDHQPLAETEKTPLLMQFRRKQWKLMLHEIKAQLTVAQAARDKAKIDELLEQLQKFQKSMQLGGLQ
jgi:DNA primase